MTPLPRTVADLQQRNFILGIPVRYLPDLPGVAYARGIWPFKWIAVGQTWLWLPYGEQQAALMHEAGHCRHGHMELRMLTAPLCWLPWAQRLAREHEYAADAFAVSEGWGTEMMRLLKRYERAPRDPIDVLLSPSPTERIQRILRLLAQENHHVEIAA